LQLFFEGMRKHGFTQGEIDRMSKVNPAKLLSLE
jgi:predicted metal-dependent phosphotriesterase family hydrolase